MRLVDTHAHLDQDVFEQDLPQVLENARAVGVQAMLTIGITRETCEAAVSLAQEHDDIYAVVGIQPNYCSRMEAGDWERIVELADAPKVVGIGETGMDRYWDYCPLDVQRDYFAKHLALAREKSLPFVVHCRDAEADVLEVLQADFQEHGPLRGVMHSFVGSVATAEQCLLYGMHISFAGMVTFKKNKELREVAALVPEDRLLIETDSPYLSPEPVRKIRRNEPAHVIHTAKVLAEVHGVSPEQLAEQTTNNAMAVFNLPLA